MLVPAPWPRSWGTHPHRNASSEARGPPAAGVAHPSDTTGRWRNPARQAVLSGGAVMCGWYKGPMTHAVASRAFPAPEHDHDLCLEEAMERARAAFQNKGLKLTPLRQSVFREIAASHK